MLSVIIVTLLEIPKTAAVKLSGSMIVSMWSRCWADGSGICRQLC